MMTGGTGRRLWSLWEIMNEFPAESFLSIGTTLELLFTVTTKEDDERGWSTFAMGTPKASLEKIREPLANVGANLSIMSVDRILLDLAKMPKDIFGARIDELSRRIHDELSIMKFLHIPIHMQKYFEPKAPLFGANVDIKFVSASFELDESAKCLALGRPTASVFHLMRIMEIGIRATARCLQTPDPTKPAERNWGYILGEIRRGIEAKWPGTADRMSGDGALFEELQASLSAVRNPWRNATMHIEKTYTDDEAEHIFVAVRGFMMKLASRCDENGDPKA